jgi:spermidine synthase
VPRAYADLFLVSFLILFFELAAIRWFAGTVVFLTFFTNIVLLACFLGMSVGLLAAGRARNLVRSSLPLAMLTMALAVLAFVLYVRWEHQVTITLGGQQASPQFVYFGTEYRPADPARWLIPVWAVGGTFFVLIALTFVGLGQVMGRAFAAIPDRVLAYTVDVAGSLTGIAAFAAMSQFELPPTIWFVPIVLLILYFADWRDALQTAAAAATLLVAAIGAHELTAYGSEIYWSPYYKIAYARERGEINTNSIGHQSMIAVSRTGSVYRLPYLLNRDAGGKALDDVLIIGAGSGNDVAAALQSGAQHVDAVEIDPRIQKIGSRDHPDRPYADPRVTVHLDDGRSFVRRTGRKYDLVVYAVVDSLVLHSGYSSLRLENFLFTREAFAEVRRALKPDGVFVMYNFYRQGWIVGRLATMAEAQFGAKPLVISLPHREAIKAEDSQAGAISFVLAGADSARLRAMREAFERAGNFWLNPEAPKSAAVNGFRAAPPGPEWHRVAPAASVAGAALLPSDDWPHLYLRERAIPWAPIGQGMLAMALLSLGLLAAFAPFARVRPNAQMFFLGAGFMLLETKGVVHMALLFGSTWVVNSVVFAAILLMILCANLFVLKVRPRRLGPYYAALIAALAVNALVPMSAFLSLEPLARTLASCAVVFLPVFFAGLIFAAVFAESRQPDVDFGWNIAGIILGGLSEQLSLVLGFNSLVLVALAYYVLSLALRPRYSSA